MQCSASLGTSMVEFESPLIEGRLQRRYQRFFADVSLPNGEVVTAHCANTGRMTGLLREDARVWLRPQLPGRKLAYAWELVETETGLACVNTARANQVLANANTETWLPGTSFVRREPRLGSHRFDLELARAGQPVFVEIKSVTLCEGHVGYFPDAPSHRASAHLGLLAELAAQGVETHVVFAAMHTGIQTIEPARAIDPKLAEACQIAEQAGVQISALSIALTPERLIVQGALPWHS